MVQIAAAATTSHLPPLPDITPAKRRVYEAAVELFAIRGYHGVSLRDLATYLGIKAPSIYAHVATKQELLFDLARIGQLEYLGRIRGALLDTGTEPPQQVTAIVRAHVLAHLELPFLARVASIEIRNLDANRLNEIEVLRGEAGRVFNDVIMRGQERGAFNIPNPARVTRAIADMGICLAEWNPPADPSEHQSLADDYARLALRMLGWSHP